MASITASAVSLQVRDAGTRLAKNPRSSRRSHPPLLDRPGGTNRHPHPNAPLTPNHLPIDPETPVQMARARPVAARRSSFAGAAVRYARVPQIAASRAADKYLARSRTSSIQRSFLDA